MVIFCHPLNFNVHIFLVLCSSFLINKYNRYPDFSILDGMEFTYIIEIQVSTCLFLEVSFL